MTDAEMQALRGAAEKATPGPWEVETDLGGEYIQIAAFDDTGNRALCIRAQSFRVADDAAYIALANPAAVLALLDRVAAAEARLEAAWRAGRDAAAAYHEAEAQQRGENDPLYSKLRMHTHYAEDIRALQPPVDLAAAVEEAARDA